MFSEHPQQQARRVLAGNMPQRQMGLGVLAPLASVVSVCRTRSCSDGNTHRREELRPIPGLGGAELGCGQAVNSPVWPFLETAHLEQFLSLWMVCGDVSPKGAIAAVSVGHRSGAGQMLENWQLPLEQTCPETDFSEQGQF